MEAILAKVLERFRAPFTGKGLNTALDCCASPGKRQTKVQTQTTQTYWRKVPCSHMLFGCLLFYQFSKPTLRVVRKEAQEQSRVVGNKLVTNGPPTSEPLTPCPLSLFRVGFMTLQLQHLEDLGWKTFTPSDMSYQHSTEGSLAENQSLQQVLEYLWCFSLSWMGWWTPSFLF